MVMSVGPESGSPLKPGRELDKLIAEKVFGREIVTYNSIGRPDYFAKNLDGSLTLIPLYSTHIAGAWAVVEELTERKGAHFELHVSREGRLAGFDFDQPLKRATAKAADGPHAICLAALRLVGVDLKGSI